MPIGQSPGSIANRFSVGHSGNPSGRPAGTRNKFSAQFVADVAADWDEHGKTVLERVRIESPERYLEVCSRLVPKEVALAVEQRFPGGLNGEEWEMALAVFAGIKAAMPDAATRSPADVLQFVADAIRLASAVEIPVESGNFDHKISNKNNISGHR